MDFKLDLSSFGTPTPTLDPSHTYDCIIIGGGPAALSALLYTKRKQMDTALITGDIGGQIVQSSTIENWLGTPEIASSSLVNNFFSHVDTFGAPIKKETFVLSMVLKGAVKKIICSDGNTYSAQTVIIATGKSPRKLGIPGEESLTGRGVAYCTTCDGPAFKGKHVVVVGGGNSGVEASLDILSYASKLTVVQNLEDLTADGVLSDKLKSNPTVEIFYNSVCVEVVGKGSVEGLKIKSTTNNLEHTIDCDGVFIEIGLIPASSFAPAEIKNPSGEIEVDAACATKIPGVFAAGDVTTVPYKQVVIAAGEGAKAALSAHGYLMSLPK